MDISLLYTTARTHLISEVLERWLGSAADPGRLEIVVVTDDPTGRESHGNIRYLVNTGRRDCVTGWNLAAANAVGDVLVQVSDDLFPPPAWDSEIIEIISNLTKEQPDVVLNLLDDRNCEEVIYHPVLTRAAYEKLGYLYPPEFESMFCDNWFFAYHSKYSLCVVSEERFWTHVHRTTHSVKVDRVMMIHESEDRYRRGRQTLEKYLDLHALR